MTNKKHFYFLQLLVGLLSCVCLDAWSQQRDDLQEYLDQIASQQSAQHVTKGVKDVEPVTVPTGLTEIDLSKFSSGQNRTSALSIQSSVKFVNGTISASSNYSGNDCLLKVSAGATVVLDATASVNASATALPLAAVGLYGGSTFYQCGDITAPNKGTGIAIYIDGATDTYSYVSGTTTGTISNPNGGTINGLDGETEAYAVLSTDGTTLSFYYDGKKSSRDGQVFTELNYNGGIGMPWCNSTITTVVFDKTFANYDELTNMSGWFYKCSSLTTLSGLEYVNTTNVTDMFEMFAFCSVLTTLDLSSFNTSNVTNMYGMFRNCSGLTSIDLSSFNTSKVTDMLSMFYGCSGLTNLDLSSFNTSNVTDMRGMFYGCSGLTSLDLSNFNTSSVTAMSEMFENCSGLTSLDLSNFNTSNVTNMSSMFSDCSGLTTIKVGDGWTTDNVTSSSKMFSLCTSLVGGDGTVFDSNYTDKTKAYAGVGGYLTKDGQVTSKYTKEELLAALSALSSQLSAMDEAKKDAVARYQNVINYIDAKTQTDIMEDFVWYDDASTNYHATIAALSERINSSPVSEYDVIGSAIEITGKNIADFHTEAIAKLEKWQEAVKAAAAADLQAKLNALGAELTELLNTVSKQKKQCESYRQYSGYYFCREMDNQIAAHISMVEASILGTEKEVADKVNTYNALINSSSIGSVEDIAVVYEEYEALAKQVDDLTVEVWDCRSKLSVLDEAYNALPVIFPDESLAFTIAPYGISKEIQIGYKSDRGFVLTSAGKMQFEQVSGADFLLRDMNGNYLVATKDSPTLTAGTKDEATVWTGFCSGYSNGKGHYRFYSKEASRYITCDGGDVNAKITAEAYANNVSWTIEKSTLDDLQAFLNLLAEEQESGSDDISETDTLTIVLPMIDEPGATPIVFPVRPGLIRIKPVRQPVTGLVIMPIPIPNPGQPRPENFHPITIPRGSHVILDNITFRDIIGGNHVIYVEGIVEIDVTVKIYLDNWDWFIHVGPGGRVIWRTDGDDNERRPRLKNGEDGTIDIVSGHVGYIDNQGTVNHSQGTIDHVINRKTYHFTGGIVGYVDNRGHWHHSNGTAYRVHNTTDGTYEMTGGEINNITGNATDTIFINYGRFHFRGGWMRGHGSRFIYHYRNAYLYINGGLFDFTHIRHYFIEAHEDFYIRGDYDYAPTVPYLLRPSVTIRILYRWIYKFNIVFIDGRPTPRYPLFHGEDFDLSPIHYPYIDWDLPDTRWRWHYDPKGNTIEPRNEEVYDEDDLQAYLNWLVENRDGDAYSTEDEPQTLSLGGREIVITQPVELPVETHVIILDGHFVTGESWSHERMFYVPKTSTMKFVNVVFDFSSQTHYIVSGVPVTRYIFHIYGGVHFGTGCRILGYYDMTRTATDDYLPGAVIAAAPEGRIWIDGAHFEGVTFLTGEKVSIYVISRLINHIYVYVPTIYRHKGFRFIAPWQDYRIDQSDLEFVKLINADDWMTGIDDESYVFLKEAGQTGIRSVTDNAETQYPAYDLRGRTLIGRPRGQIYIQNGKKYISK